VIRRSPSGALVAAALLLAACSPAVPGERASGVGAPARAPAPAATPPPAAADPPAGGGPAEGSTRLVTRADVVAVVPMEMRGDLRRVEPQPEPLRRELLSGPPPGVDVGALGPGPWTFGEVPVTRTEAIPFAVSATRDRLILDGDRDGVLRPDEAAEPARDLPGAWFRASALVRQPLADQVHEERVPLAILVPAGAAGWSFSRLDGVREGAIDLDGRRVRLAVVDRTFRGWFSHLRLDHLLVDVDGDGALDATEESHERYRLGEPFPVGDADVVVSEVGPLGRTLTVSRAAGPARRDPPLRVGAAAPAFDAADLTGQPVRLADLRGRWVLVDFWATWCGPCVRELPNLLDLRAQRPDLAIVGVSGDRTREALAGFLQQRPLPWPQVFDDQRTVQQLYRVRSLPRSYLLAPDGTIAAKDLRGASLPARLDAIRERWQAGRTTR
jgi:peroxiredoxin